MKILMVLMGLDIGGAETHVVELSKELRRRGHEVLIASNGGAYVPQLEPWGIRHVEMPLNRRSLRAMAVSLHRLRRLICQEHPDLVHAHARIPAFLCGILHRQLHFPFLTSAHWVFTVTPLLRLMSNWGQHTVAVSEDIRHYLWENYSIPDDQISVTINGIDTDTFAPGQNHPALRQALELEEGPVICMVSRLDESRALAAQALIDIMPRLCAEFPTAQLLLVGDGDWRQRLEHAAQTVNDALGRKAVVMTGPRTDVAELVALGHVFVGVSRAALEAMSEAKPVILAGNEGYGGILTQASLPQVQPTNFCCRGCGPVTRDALLEDLTTLLSMDSQQRQALGDFGRQLILDQYSVRRMTEDYLAAYHALLHPVPPIRAAISGYYGYRNLGDDSILLSISRQLATLDPPVQLTVLSRNPRKTTASYGLRAIPRFSPLALWRTLRRSDLLISGGGSLLQDHTSARSLQYYLGVIHLAQHFHHPVFLWANGIGPLYRPAGREHVRKTLVDCHCITLRDSDSLATLRALGVTRQDVTVTEDPAFLLNLPPKEDSLEALRQLGLSMDTPLLGISVRRTDGMAQSVDQFARLADRMVRELHCQVAFLVMQEPGDADISREILRRMEEPAQLISTPDRPEDMLGIIRCMDALVSTRLHTIIFAAKARVPVVGCVYDPKVASFLKTLQMPHCGTPKDLHLDDAMAALQTMLSHRDAIRQQLDRQVSQMEAHAGETLHQFQQMLKQQ